MSTNIPPPPGPVYAQPPVRKTNTLLWVLVGIGTFLLLVVIAVVGAGFFLVHKVKQAGIDSELIKRNPAMASVKMMAALNPNIEVLSFDEDRGKVMVREKQSGKTYSVDFEDAKRGKFVIKEDGKDMVAVNTTGDDKSGSVEIKSSDGSVKIGGGQNVKIPTWIPDYPGSAPQAAYSAQAKDADSGMYAFKTRDAIDKVTRFYEDSLKSSGLKTSSNVSNSGSGGGGMISGEDEAGKHSVTVLIGSQGGETAVTVTFTTKK